MSSSLRITGMATGLDTDTTVKQMMQTYQVKLDKMKQDKQIVQWKQDLYREIIGDINSINSTYFNNLNYGSNMLLKSTYPGFDISVTSSDAAKPTGVSITASTGAVDGIYKVVVDKLAEAAKLEGTALNESSSAFNVGNWNGQKIFINIDGVDREIDLSSENYADRATLVAGINSKITADPNLSGKIFVDESTSGGIKFNVLTSTTVKISNATTVVGELDSIKGNVINPQKSTTTLSNLGIAAAGSFTLDYIDSNGASQSKSITVSDPTTMTIQGLIDEVSKQTSGNVTLKFSELTGKFSIQTLKTGSSATLTVTDTNSILSELGFTALSDTGIDAEVRITPPGVGATETLVKKSENIFSIDGVNYTLTIADSTVTNNVTVTTNTQKTYDKIKAFIDKYNEVIDKINTKIDEKKQYTYLPLTEEQKKEMEEEDIKNWEEKAKEGLLRNDSMLSNMLTSMRSAFYEEVEGAGITLAEIGLSTSSDISKRGKIIIDETKLKDAIKTRGEQIVTLFTKTSTTHPKYDPDLSSANRSIRSSEEGIFQRINDILLDYTRTSRNDAGKKGMLLEKAGVKGDFTEFNNLLSEDMKEKEKKIQDMIDKMADKEDRYYKMFSKLESAMQQMNAQSSWLSQQLGG